ncbi:HEL004Cp [Eremothecium sinecaudum]|uniref:HEL004Cp n=1 Tax=Eremothecium sinecaudum TaxID=45286 RepID=A0A0X8HTP6_9SACH|nr:HEL004Cp [Eremothecium sinecaudum]AMD21276.1 HEL004Cp [Eremothecium sinecaudum]
MGELNDNELTAAIKELTEQNDSLSLAIQRTRLSVKRLRLEYAVLLERLENRINKDPSLHYDEPLPTLASFKANLLMSLPTSRSRKRRAKEKRDPNLPKRPTNAYLLFCEMNKEKIRQEHAASNLDMTKVLPEIWKNMDEEAKKPYYDLYNADRLRYQREMTAYSQTKTVEEPNVDVKNESGNDEEDVDEPEPEVDGDGMDVNDSDVTRLDDGIVDAASSAISSEM